MIEDGGGAVVPFGDIQALADVVGRWIGDDGLRRDTGQIARGIVQDRYSMSRYVEWLIQIGLD